LAGDTTDAAGSPTWSVMSPTFLWLLGLLVILLPMSVAVLARRQ
jgi:hypothetical protein